jgi:NADPH-dependent 2,4-dienoyl-CoA reductase/sulfur reductase-like enzyme
MGTIDTVVVGAGPAGLAVGKELRERDVPFEILERASDIASSWRRHYDRLHLHTAKRYSSLPGMAFPSNAPAYPSRAAVVDYLMAYAERYHLKPRFGVDVERIERDDAGSGWRLRTNEGLIASTRVVIAAGYNAVPSQPRWPGMEAYTGEVLHSSAYRNADRWKGKHVLVVGAGNSGAEIALDLVENSARVDLCVRGKLHVTLRDTFGMPTPLPAILLTKLPLRMADIVARAALRLTVGDLSKWGIEAPDIGPIRGIVERARIPIIDVGTLSRIKSGEIVVRKGIERFESNGVTFVDGQRQAYDAIVLATGFRPGLERFLDDADALLDMYGRAPRGGAELRPGLYLVGYTLPATGLLREIGFEARRTATDIAKKRETGSVPAHDLPSLS